MNVLLRELPPALLDVEVVEHKGIGHPDTICDAVAEAASRALSREYLARHGTILHHNVDKALLVGGRADARLGGGVVHEPMVLHLAGTASEPYAGEVVVEAAREWMTATMHALDVDRHVVLVPAVHRGSADLVDLFSRGRRANDTSMGAGYAPLSMTERLVLASADRLRALARDPATPEIGEDTKVLAVRRARRVELTVACALIGAHLPSIDRYVAMRAEIASEVQAAALAVAGEGVEVEVVVNAADDVDRGSIYLTVTGTSAESGDDGQVGRGNRVNGLITPLHPMTLEAAAGKNPVTHVGKLYNVAAHALAHELVAEVPEIERAECLLVSRIGRPIDDPALVDVRVGLGDGATLESVRARVDAITRARIGRIPSSWEPIVRGEVRLF